MMKSSTEAFIYQRTFAGSLRELPQNPTLNQIAQVAALGNADERARLDRATKLAFGAGIPWDDALRNTGLLTTEGGPQ